jgi:hypothetical protein
MYSPLCRPFSLFLSEFKTDWSAQTIWTFIVYGGGVAIEHFAPHLFYRIAFLIGYIFSVIFWLSGWAWAASSAAFWLAFTFGYSNPGTQEGSALAACAGLGAVVW